MGLMLFSLLFKKYPNIKLSTTECANATHIGTFPHHAFTHTLYWDILHAEYKNFVYSKHDINK